MNQFQYNFILRGFTLMGVFEPEKQTNFSLWLVYGRQLWQQDQLVSNIVQYEQYARKIVENLADVWMNFLEQKQQYLRKFCNFCVVLNNFYKKHFTHTIFFKRYNYFLPVFKFLPTFYALVLFIQTYYEHKFLNKSVMKGQLNNVLILVKVYFVQIVRSTENIPQNFYLQQIDIILLQFQGNLVLNSVEFFFPD
eukprot:TRINITY_DN32123_c0_g2_i2.p1 TRINITY_DN32123_c0_g2~~TRINITY_DN32123_c0_g2_i2.p1  ORF type:complete len:194 (+),score=0.64 TRINITY_DN32123_c0_g2_i2:259-840(+)